MTYALALWLAHWSSVDAEPPPEPVVWVETGWACNGSPSGKMVDCVGAEAGGGSPMTLTGIMPQLRSVVMLLA